MVNVTPRARQLLALMLRERDIPPDRGFRLVSDPLEGFSLLVTAVREGDQVVDHDGYLVLLVGSDVAVRADGASVDVYDTLEGPALKFSQR